MNKETLIREFERCYDKNGWFVAVRNAIDGLDVHQAIWKPDDIDINCIWEMLSHITYYNYAYLQRFKGIDYKYDVTTNNETFSVGEYEEAEWQADVMRFDEVMTEWRNLIQAADDKKLLGPVSSEIPNNWIDAIATVNSHNAYHGGQIVLVRKLQGCWDPSAGVN
jgi:uncharacterized damage-inducible protein DinB